MGNESDYDHECDGCAYGLSDNDILELIKLIRTATDEKIISISSRGSNAEVWTGFLADGEAGSGKSFSCVRTSTGWAIKEATEWLA